MSDEYKNSLYNNYVASHIKPLYGDHPDIKKITKGFNIWDYYYCQFLPKNKKAAILDLGCGEGSFVYWLTKKGYSNVKGVDISTQQIQLGNKLGISNIYCDDIFNFLSGDIKFDFVFAKDILEHLTKQEIYDILNAIHKSLNPRGKIFIQVPNAQGIFFTEVYYGDFTHEIAFTISSLNQVLVNSHFMNIRCFPVNPAPLNVRAVIRLLLWKGFIGCIKILKALETGNTSGIFTRNILCIAEKI